MVTDVSAMLVARMHLRTPSGAMSNTFSWSSTDSALCSGRMIQRLHALPPTPAAC